MLLTAATTLYQPPRRPRRQSTQLLVCEFRAAGTSAAGTNSEGTGGRRTRPPPEGPLPAWVAKLSPVEKQLAGWGASSRRC